MNHIFHFTFFISIQILSVKHFVKKCDSYDYDTYIIASNNSHHDFDEDIENTSKN